MQVDLGPLGDIVRAVGEGLESAAISPALDDLYALLGRCIAPDAEVAAERLVAQVCGARLINSKRQNSFMLKSRII